MYGPSWWGLGLCCLLSNNSQICKLHLNPDVSDLMRMLQFAGRSDITRAYRSRCLPLEFAQDFLHSTWRWRSRHGSHWSEEAFGPILAHPPGHPHRGHAWIQERQGSLWNHGSSTLWIFPDPPHLLCLHLHDGQPWPDWGNFRLPSTVLMPLPKFCLTPWTQLSQPVQQQSLALEVLCFFLHIHLELTYAELQKICASISNLRIQSDCVGIQASNFECQLHGSQARGSLQCAVQGQVGHMRPRIHHWFAQAGGVCQRDSWGCGQAPEWLRLPCTHNVLACARNPHDWAHWIRKQGGHPSLAGIIMNWKHDGIRMQCCKLKSTSICLNIPRLHWVCLSTWVGQLYIRIGLAEA